jgi:hypothetical protein
MAVKKFTASSIKNDKKYQSLLAGNDYYTLLSYVSIATGTGNGSSGTISFTSIPSTYTHLQIRGISRDARAVTVDTGYFVINSDTGTNYAYHLLNGNGSTASAGANSSSAPSNTSVFVIPGTSAGASMMSATITDFFDYKNTNKYKTIRTLSGVDLNGSGNTWFTSALWMNTNAITQIDVVSGTGSAWTTDTKFALYGIKG